MIKDAQIRKNRIERVVILIKGINVLKHHLVDGKEDEVSQQTVHKLKEILMVLVNDELKVVQSQLHQAAAYYDDLDYLHVTRILYEVLA